MALEKLPERYQPEEIRNEVDRSGILKDTRAFLQKGENTGGLSSRPPAIAASLRRAHVDFLAPEPTGEHYATRMQFGWSAQECQMIRSDLNAVFQDCVRAKVREEGPDWLTQLSQEYVRLTQAWSWEK